MIFMYGAKITKAVSRVGNESSKLAHGDNISNGGEEYCPYGCARGVLISWREMDAIPELLQFVNQRL